VAVNGRRFSIPNPECVEFNPHKSGKK